MIIDMGVIKADYVAYDFAIGAIKAGSGAHAFDIGAINGWFCGV